MAGPRCPRCGTEVGVAADAAGFVTCPQCGARLRKGTEPPRAPTPPPSPPTRPAPSVPVAPRPVASSTPPAGLEILLSEIRAVRRVQEDILALLKSRAPDAPAPTEDAADAADLPDDDFPVPPVRTRRRKTVLLVDDDAQTRLAAAEALQGADVPIEVVTDGSAAIASIAENRPDVIVLELAMGGAMGGKDVINMIKATMEWVDIPIILYTRLPISGPQEARTVHGADDYVVKGPSGPQHLVARVISFFRSRG